MKKIFYLIAAIGLTWTVVSCDNEPKNPGDYSVKSELSLGNIVSQVNGEVYPLRVSKSIDTVFTTKVTVYDTIWDANGDYVSRESRDVYVPSKVTTKYVEYEPVVLPVPADTFGIQISTNARWLAAPLLRPRGGVQFYNDATTSGGGDGTLIFRSDYNEFYTTTAAAALNIYTSDSTVYHRVNLHQLGEMGD